MIGLDKNHSEKLFGLALAQRLLGDRLLGASAGLNFRGGQAAIMDDESDEVLLSGPAGTGKSVAVMHKINREMWKYPRARALIVRQVRADLAETALVTFEDKILGADNPICAGIQRENRRVYRYPNGSEIVVGGMDRPMRVMSAEYDMIYVQEAVELKETAWEALSTRLRNGRMPYQQLIADCNPARPDHWLKKRCDEGLTKIYYTNHHDNPAYWDGERWTKQGENYMSRLTKLKGTRRARLLEGKWVMSEGMVYGEWDESVHVVDPYPVPADWVRFMAVDFGFTNPFVAQWWAIDPDGRMVLYREMVGREVLVEDWAVKIREASAGETILATVADHDAEDRATLKRHGISTRGANKAVSEGIQAVSERLRVAEDGKPRLTVMRGCTRVVGDADDCGLAREILGYVWSDKTTKEAPVKESDHSMDAMRYAVMYAGKAGRKPIISQSNPFFD